MGDQGIAGWRDSETDRAASEFVKLRIQASGRDRQLPVFGLVPHMLEKNRNTRNRTAMRLSWYRRCSCTNRRSDQYTNTGVNIVIRITCMQQNARPLTQGVLDIRPDSHFGPLTQGVLDVRPGNCQCVTW